MRTEIIDRSIYLSGSNFSGSGQYLGFLWNAGIGSVTSVPLGMNTPFTVISFFAALFILEVMINQYNLPQKCQGYIYILRTTVFSGFYFF